MKGVILAGGKGTRLYPLTRVTNKHLLPVYNKPMVYYPIRTLANAGIKDILIVSGKGHAGHFLELLGSGQEFGVHLSYDVQEEAGGIAHALKLAERFARGEPIIVILGDNVFRDDLSDVVNEFSENPDGAIVFLKEVQNPSSYGVAVFDEEGSLIAIEEKPKEPKSNLIVTGVYFYSHDVFDIVKTLNPSARGELEITDVNNAYLQQGKLRHRVLEHWWGDCGESFESLLEASRLVAEWEQENK